MEGGRDGGRDGGREGRREGNLALDAPVSEEKEIQLA